VAAARVIVARVKRFYEYAQTRGRISEVCMRPSPLLIGLAILIAPALAACPKSAPQGVGTTDAGPAASAPAPGAGQATSPTPSASFNPNKFDTHPELRRVPALHGVPAQQASHLAAPSRAAIAEKAAAVQK
jgi:hypothetical protein